MPTQVHPKKYSLGHKSQNKGHGVGVPTKVLDNYPKGGGSGAHQSQPSGHGMSIPTRGNTVKSTGAKSPGNSGGVFKTRGKVLINSGVSGAHRIGCKK